MSCPSEALSKVGTDLGGRVSSRIDRTDGKERVESLGAMSIFRLTRRKTRGAGILQDLDLLNRLLNTHYSTKGRVLLDRQRFALFQLQ